MSTESRSISSSDKLSERHQILAERVRALGGRLGETDDFRRDSRSRDFRKRLLAAEKAPPVTHREWLARHGLVFPPPAELPADQLSSELWRLIESLAFARVFLSSTGHLSDAELYARLWNDVLGADEPDVPRYEDEMFQWDFAVPGDETWLACYATEEDREGWEMDYPDSPLPARRPLPHPRDDRLPRCG